jgi:outer membrane receptor protein involved in Fe transport
MNLTVREPVRTIETELAFSFFNASALSLGTLGAADQGDWLVAARRGNLDLVFDVIDPDFGTPNYNDTMLHFGWEFGPRSVFTANYLTSTDKIFIDDEERGETARADYLNEVFWGKWLADWNDRLSSATILSYSSIRNDRSGELDLPGIVSGELAEFSRFRVTALKQDWTFVASRQWMLSAGLDVKHLDGYFDFDSTRNIEPPFDELFDNAPITQRSASIESDGDQFAVYVEAKWQPRPDLVFEGGARWDQQSYTLASGDTQTSPRLSALYKPNDSTDLRIGWGQFSQAQEANELQVSDGVYEFFAAQRAEHIVANLKHRFDNGVDLDLSLYRKSFRKLRSRFENAFNPLTIVPEIQFDRLRIDARKGESRGAEILLSRGEADVGLFWWLGYAWSSVEDRLDGGDIRRSWDQTHAAKAGLSWRWYRWNFSAAGELHTGWPRTEMTGDTVIGPDGTAEIVLERTAFNARRHSLYHALDARVSREFELRRGTLTAFLEVTNLYNRENGCCLEYSVRTVDGVPALSEREANWLPLLPSLGIIWNF